jgi:hypothetical protein
MAEFKSKEYEVQEWDVNIALYKNLTNLEYSLKEITTNLIHDLKTLSNPKSSSGSSLEFDDFIKDTYNQDMIELRGNIEELLTQVTYVLREMNKVASVNGKTGNVIITADDLNIPLVSQTENGLITSKDKLKLDSIESNANYYSHPTYHDPSIIKEDSTHRFFTDEERIKLNKTDEKFSSVENKITLLEKIKLNISDIVNDLTTGGTSVPLSAEMGKVLYEQISSINLVELENEITFVKQYVKNTISQINENIETIETDINSMQEELGMVDEKIDSKIEGAVDEMVKEALEDNLISSDDIKNLIEKARS